MTFLGLISSIRQAFNRWAERTIASAVLPTSYSLAGVSLSHPLCFKCAAGMDQKRNEELLF